jgi:hypothetical protein
LEGKNQVKKREKELKQGDVSILLSKNLGALPHWCKNFTITSFWRKFYEHNLMD